MQKVTVLHNQNLLDVTMQSTGKAENLMKIAAYNNLVPTEPLAPGTVLTIPDTVDTDADIVRYYAANGIQPATALTATQTENLELTFWQKVVNAFRK
ncbi:hypothetical protein QWY81_17940 [Polaribacter undariae]|uniref:LysM domain-containing protein n=1 Tax=Polaribacter sejongensis TaxID=985043 RepID=A0AAJ1VIK7_9FLAO|nr:hypothetical protein [Polaribacter undariae]MDN3621354.1 hypothetical protein [Polaribacter undariae]UWD31896.1 hypothetical protein NQP51_17405 [Polaribacter undariae]